MPAKIVPVSTDERVPSSWLVISKPPFSSDRFPELPRSVADGFLPQQFANSLRRHRQPGDCTRDADRIIDCARNDAAGAVDAAFAGAFQSKRMPRGGRILGEQHLHIGDI